MQTDNAKRTASITTSAPKQQHGSVPCPYCGGRAWFRSPVPDDKPCSCQACGGTGRVHGEN